MILYFAGNLKKRKEDKRKAKKKQKKSKDKQRQAKTSKNKQRQAKKRKAILEGNQMNFEKLLRFE